MVFYWELENRNILLKCVYKKNGEKGVANIKLMFNIIKQLPERVSFEPIAIQIEPTNMCNLKCKMCFRNWMPHKEEHMNFSTFKRIIKQFPFLLRVHIQGAGEPLLNKDLFKMISFLKEKGVYSSFTTNCTILNKKIIDRIIKSGIDRIETSIDGATKETFEKIRVGSNFGVFSSNYKKILALKNEGIDVTSNIIVLNDNIKELPEIIEFISNSGGVKEITILDCMGGYYKSMVCKKQLFCLDNGVKEKYFKLAMEKARDLNLNIEVLKNSNSRVRLSCLWPWLSCNINCNGDVTPCCAILDYNLGNVLDKPFNEIWNSKKYIYFRKKLKSKTISERCLMCDFL